MPQDERVERLAQVINDSLFAMMAGEPPTDAERQEPNGGDMQLAFDIIAAGYETPDVLSDTASYQRQANYFAMRANIAQRDLTEANNRNAEALRILKLMIDQNEGEYTLDDVVWALRGE